MQGAEDGDAGAPRGEATCISAPPKSRFHSETAAASTPSRSTPAENRPERLISSCFSIFCSGPQPPHKDVHHQRLSPWLNFTKPLADFSLLASIWMCSSIASSTPPLLFFSSFFSLLFPSIHLSAHLAPLSSLLHPEEVGHALLKLPCSVTSSSIPHNSHNPQYSAL